MVQVSVFHLGRNPQILHLDMLAAPKTFMWAIPTAVLDIGLRIPTPATLTPMSCEQTNTLVPLIYVLACESASPKPTITVDVDHTSTHCSPHTITPVPVDLIISMRCIPLVKL